MINESLVVKIHESAVSVVNEISHKEFELVLILQEVIRHKVYRAYKYPSLFSYLTVGLKFSEHRAYDFSVVVKASMRFKKLHEELAQRRISVSKARRIVPVLEEGNEEEWLHKACVNNHRSLEKLVAGKNTEVSFGERVRYVSDNQVEVTITMSEKEYLEFKRAQDVLCQKQKRPVSMKSTLMQTTKVFLEKTDPTLKAVRHQERQMKKEAVQIKQHMEESARAGCHKNKCKIRPWFFSARVFQNLSTIRFI